jgi:hypothetical protein
VLLSDYLCRYNSTHDLRTSTAEHYHWVVASFRHLHGDVELSSLSGELLHAWLRWLRDHGRSPWTVRQRRISLLVIWRAAWLDGLAPAIPPLQRLRRLQTAPEAWTVAEVKQLILTAEAWPVRSLWTSSLVRAGYDTGLRLGDLLDRRVGQLSGEVLQLVQAKTGRVVTVRLRPVTLGAIEKLTLGQPPGSRIWPLWGRREAFYRHMKQVVLASGIRPGTFKWLRRSAATACERAEPGSGTLLLGHQHRSTTETWYLDRSQLAVPPLPPL